MKSKSLLFNIFFIGIFLSSLAYSSLVLDFTLTPRLIVISIIIIFSLFLWFKTNVLKSIKMDFIVLSYVSYVLFSCLSGFWANTPTESIFENAKLIIALSVFLFSYYFFKTDKEATIKYLAKISVGIVFVEFVLVAYQLSGLTEFTKEAMYQVYGANSHKNLLSSFLYISLFFLLIGLFRMNKIWKWLIVTALILNIGMIIIIQTKAVWIAVAVSMILLLILLLYKQMKLRINLKWGLISCIILANVFFVFVQPRIIKRVLAFNIEHVQNENSGSTKELDNERLQLWDKTYAMIYDHPLIGVGAGNWQIYFPDATLKGMYRAEDLNFTFQRPHNDVLWIVSETGFVGFNLFLIFITSLLIFLVKILESINEKIIKSELVICFITIIGFFTAAFFDFPKERIEHLIWINIVFGFAYFSIKEEIVLKNLLEFKISTMHFIFMEFVLIMVLIVGVNRYQGEFYTRKMYNQKKQNNNQGVLREAKKVVNFTYSIDPTSLPIKWYTGNSFALLGNFMQAKRDLLEAYRLNPYNRNVINDLASAYVNTQQQDSAEYYYLEAVRISPRFDDPKLNLAAIYFNQKQFEKADSCLKTLLHDSERRTKYQTMVNAFLGKKISE